MAQTIKLKRSATQNAVPSTSSLALGEIALNTYDGKLFIKKDVGGTESIVTIGAVGAGSIGPTELASTAVTAGSYGSTSAIPVITIDADGRITSASTATISGLSANSVTSTEIAANAVGISELDVTDGTDGQVLTTDGSGTLTFETPTGGAASANAFATNVASGNGSTATFTLSSTPSAESKIIAFINGVFQNQDAYTISGTDITFDTAPISGTNNVVIYVIGDVYSGESVLISNFDGDSSTTAFTLSNNPGNENNTQVYIDGVYQQKTTYSVSGTTLTFSSAPPTGTANIEVVMLTSTTVNTPAAGSVVTASMADDSVTGAKIVSSAVTTAKIADVNVTTAKIADANITTAKIADDAVTIGKIADAALVIESEGISSNDNDTTLPTSAAVKDYVDTQVAGKDALSELSGDTDDVTEGSTNLYFTNARADARITNALKDEDNMASNSATHIPSQQSVKAYVDSQVASKDALSELSGDTDDVTEGSTNLYYTDARVGTYISGNRTYGNITTTGYLAGPSTFTIDPAAVGDNTGTLVIAGNLQVDGTTTTINSTTLTVDDKLVTLGSGSANAGAANGAGIEVDITGSTNPSLTYDGTNDEWDFNKDINVTGSIRIDNGASFTAYEVYRDNILYGRVGGGSNQFTIQASNNKNINLFDDSGVGLTVKDGGNVGIGTASPQGILHIDKGASGDNITILETHSAGDSKLIFSQGQTAGNWAIGYDDGSGADENSLGFAYRSDGYPSLTTHNKMILTPAGRLGIGTTSPAYKLEVESSSDADLIQIQSTASANNTVLRLGISGDVATLNASGGSTGALAFKTYGTGRMHIDSSGNVGIGTSVVTSPGLWYDANPGYLAISHWATPPTPAAMLHLSDNSNDLDVPQIRIEGRENAGDTKLDISVKDAGVRLNLIEGPGGDASNGYGLMEFKTNAAINTSNPTRGGFKFITPADANNLVITNTGNVGIGTSSPQHKLDVEGGNNVFDLARFGSSASDNSEVTIGYFDANANNGIPALITASDFGGLIQGGEHGHLVLGIRDNDATDALDIVSGGGNFMTDSTYDTLVATFKANGKVGIGTAVPDRPLHVIGQVAIEDQLNATGALLISAENSSNKIYSRTVNDTTSAKHLDIIQNSAVAMRIADSGNVGIGDTDPPSTLTVLGTNTTHVASNGAGIAGLHVSRTSSKGENLYMYMIDSNATSVSWSGVGSIGRVESYGNNAFEIGSQQNIPVVIGQNNTQKIRIKGDITTHAKFGSTYIESLYTPNGGVQNCRIFEDHLGKWVAVGYFAANAATSIQSTWGSVRGGPTGIGQSETTQFSADWGDSYPTEVRYMGATDFNNFQETKTIDFIHGVPVGRPWKQFFNNAHRIPDGGTDVSVSLMGKVQGSVGALKNGWECRGAYDGRGRWHNPSYTHHRMSDDTSINCADTAFTTPTSSHFNWNAASDAKISVHHSFDYSGQDTAGYSAAFGRDDTVVAFFDDYPNSRNNMQSSTNNYGTAVYVLMKLPEMQSIGLEGGHARSHAPGEVVQTRVYQRNADVSTTGAQTTFGYIDFTPKYGNSLLEFNIHANTGANADTTAAKWQIYRGSSSAIGTKIRETGNQLLSGYDSQVDGMPLPFSYTQYFENLDDKKVRV